MAHYDIFREQLAIKYPASGHALWEPSPRRGQDRVQVGDVGFIREGEFHRLFNALLSADHPTHDELGVPQYHEPLVPSVSNHISKSVLSCNHYCSVGVTMETEPDHLASKPEDCQEVLFSCRRKQGGAVLSIPVDAQRENTLALRDFGKWMIKHIDVWFLFAQNLGFGIEQMEEIVLVTGCDCTRSWMNIAFLEGQGDTQALFGVTNPEASINWKFSPARIRGALLNKGPEGKDLPKNQCIFIRGFRVARTLRILPKHLKAAGVPSDLHENDSDSDRDATLISSSPINRDPLHLLLDYIAERAHDCDTILVHDDDLERVVRICDDASLNGLQPDVVMRHLRDSNLGIHQVPCDLSSSKESSNTSPDFVRVATLSVIFHNQSPPFPLTLGLLAPQDSVTTQASSSTRSNARGWVSPPALTQRVFPPLAVAEPPLQVYTTRRGQTRERASLFDAPSQSITPAVSRSLPAFHSSQRTSPFDAPTQSITPAVSRSRPAFHSSERTSPFDAPTHWQSITPLVLPSWPAFHSSQITSLFGAPTQSITPPVLRSLPGIRSLQRVFEVQEDVNLLDDPSDFVLPASSQSQATNLDPYRMRHRPRPYPCPKCGQRFIDKRGRDRHILSYLPYSLYCPFPRCPWRGDHHTFLKYHWRKEHDEAPMPSQIKIYDAYPLVKSVVEGALTVESAAGTALSEVEKRAGELDKIGVWADWWGRKTKVDG